MCLALVVKLLYVFSSAEDRAVFFQLVDEISPEQRSQPWKLVQCS